MVLNNPGRGGAGKVVGDKRYLHVDSLPKLAETGQAETLLARISQAEMPANVRRGEQFNLVRADITGNAFGLLHYPGFSDVPFPALGTSWVVDLKTGSVGFRTYSESLKPPILHRKELLLPADDPRDPRLRLLPAMTGAAICVRRRSSARPTRRRINGRYAGGWKTSGRLQKSRERLPMRAIVMR